MTELIFDELLKDDKSTAITAEIMRQDFYTYLDLMFYLVNEIPFTFKPFHNRIIDKLQKIADCETEKRNLLINVPVGAGKSLIVEYFISWCYARSVDHTFCYISHSDRLITRLSKETKDIVCHPAWIKLFCRHLKKDDQSKINWSFDGAMNRTGLTAGTMGGSITGLDAGNPNKEGFQGALIIDDPIDVGNINYASYREACIENYDNKLATRRRSPNVPTILIMQRLHLLDLAGWALSVEPQDWDTLIIPALNDKGESFWAEKYPVEEMQQISRNNPVKFAAQYQQNPIVAGGQVIKTDWFKYYDNPETIEINRIFITADTAQKVKEHNDYSVFTVWGAGNNLYLLDMLRGKWESPELKKNAKAIWEKWRHGNTRQICSAFYIEDKASGTGLIQDMQAETGIPVIAIPRTTDKLTRAEDALPYIESGRVYLPINPQYSFNPIFLSECESFSRDMTHPHDDILDTLFDAIAKGLSSGSVSILDVI